MPIVDVDGCGIHCRFDGPAAASVLVLSHSIGTSLSMWDPQIEALAREFRVLRYDSRGHGRSAVTPGPYTIDRLAQDVVGLLDRLRIARAHFCGLSMGGMVGQWLGVHAPERLHKLALCNTAARIGTPEMWNARIEAVRKGGMASISAAVLERWFTPAFIASEPETVAATREVLEATSPDGYVACCAAIRDMDQREAISALRVPTLVIAGAYDGATPPADGRLLAERIRSARYVELEASHLSNIEAAPRFTAALLEFLAD